MKQQSEIPCFLKPRELMTRSKSNCSPIIPVQNNNLMHTRESGGILLSAGTYINECLSSGKNLGPIPPLSIRLSQGTPGCGFPGARTVRERGDTLGT